MAGPEAESGKFHAGNLYCPVSDSTSFRRFLADVRFPYLAGTSFLLFGLIFGAFQLLEITIRSGNPGADLTYLHLSRGMVTSGGLVIWIIWTLYEYRDRIRTVMRQHDDQYQRLLGAAVETILLTDDHHRVVYANTAAERELGWTLTDMIGKPLTEVLPVAGGVDAARNRRWEADVTTHTGRVFRADLTHVVLLDEDGRREACGVILRDLTETRLRQAQLERSERLASLGHMAAGVAHEIGNPLTAISSIIQLMQKRPQDEFTTEQLQVVRENVNRINKIVRDLVDFSRPKRADLAPTYLNDLAEQAVGLMRHDSRCRDIRFEADLAADLPTVTATADRLHQVLVNLILNAVDATAGQPDRQVRIRTWADADMVHLSVEDNGKGIPIEVLPRIFEPFFTTKDVGKGTGLGLSVSHHILTGLGGRIDVESEPGRTCFSLRIPRETIS